MEQAGVGLLGLILLGWGIRAWRSPKSLLWKEHEVVAREGTQEVARSPEGLLFRVKRSPKDWLRLAFFVWFFGFFLWQTWIQAGLDPQARLYQAGVILGLPLLATLREVWDRLRLEEIGVPCSRTLGWSIWLPKGTLEARTRSESAAK